MKFWLGLFLGLALISSMEASPGKSKQEILKEEEQQVKERVRIIASFYEIPEGQDLIEITPQLLDSTFISDTSKKAILENQRRIFVFEYPSDSFKVKGYISVVPNPSEHPILVNLRGGNRTFGIPNPGGDIAVARDYTVIASVYRGGICEGQDEFGGEDVNDVQNLIKYIPALEEKIGEKIHNDKLFLMGCSRGAMEMFLALARFPDLQKMVTKAVSLSGLSDMRLTMIDRPDMREMFISDFGLVPGDNEEDWINHRDPMVAVEKIRADLPILMVAGTEDDRVELGETYSLIQKLTETGHNVEYIEVPGGDHMLVNQDDRLSFILDWLEQ